MRPGAALSFEFECDAKLVGSAGLEPATFLLVRNGRTVIQPFTPMATNYHELR